MTERGARLPTQALIFLVALFGAGVIVLFFPFRIADCGPADPDLIRYFGAPFFHQTGIGFVSSLEAHIWAGPMLANIAVLAGLIWVGLQGILRLIARHQTPSKTAHLLQIALSLVLCGGIALLGVFATQANTFKITLSGPDIDPQACSIHVEFGGDQNARQPAPDL